MQVRQFQPTGKYLRQVIIFQTFNMIAYNLWIDNLNN
ncbi:hypothetical protein J2T02_002237 [Chitinophaga terrae (ex Kim and Jung 2007)]|nr:hypothetical protein [Chitinophaga terrae (ex Kim and Jung 2007)]